MGGMLYLVATPIGNMSDISARAIKVLSEVDFVAAEDTRNTMRLLGCLDIKQRLISYHEHNRRERGEEIINRLSLGESCALVTDAGMPAISDPGADLVKLCAERGIPVTVIPGCCAAVTALALSGLSTTRFSFEGFLPVDGGERKKRLAEIAHERRTMIFYEAPHKLIRTLGDLLSTFGDRKIAICRELTKINEEILRTTLEGAVALYHEKKPRGEYVLIVEGGEEAGAALPAMEQDPTADMTPEERVDYYCRTQGVARMAAMKLVAKDMGISKSELYRMLLPGDEEKS
ncbi:MAG: 16S rRNA (cytidine(1402)-2'-O)-methyltransferase [Clostridia bacterium]|nr:16S rRNA (cytidine(1402)-2'-O)-methyltransferase [Clostridia bacterium]